MTEADRKSKAYRAWDNLKRRHDFKHGFLIFFATVGAPQHPDDILRRTDTEQGYVISNLDWHRPNVYGKEKRAEALDTHNDIKAILSVSRVNRQNLNE